MGERERTNPAPEGRNAQGSSALFSLPEGSSAKSAIEDFVNRQQSAIEEKANRSGTVARVGELRPAMFVPSERFPRRRNPGADNFRLNGCRWLPCTAAELIRRPQCGKHILDRHTHAIVRINKARTHDPVGADDKGGGNRKQPVVSAL